MRMTTYTPAELDREARINARQDAEKKSARVKPGSVRWAIEIRNHNGYESIRLVIGYRTTEPVDGETGPELVHELTEAI